MTSYKTRNRAHPAFPFLHYAEDRMPFLDSFLPCTPLLRSWEEGKHTLGLEV